jgi:hypothetical protein
MATPIYPTTAYAGRGKEYREWFHCACGYRSRKRRPRKHPPRMVVFRPLHCPGCGCKVSECTAYA